MESIISANPSPSNAVPPIIRPSNYVEMNSSALNHLNLTSRSKIFELSTIAEVAKVCLVYEAPEVLNPKIFLLELESLKWIFLAETFTEYLRMNIAHLGLPYWELCFSSCGLPSWTEVCMLIK